MTVCTAAVARAAHADFTLEQVTVEGPRAGEVLVRIAGVGLCHTDLVFRDQFDAFAAVLSEVDALVLSEVYPAGEAPIPGADSKSLARAIRARGRSEPVVVAMDNCQNQLVLFSDRATIEALLQLLSEEGGICSILPFDRA